MSKEKSLLELQISLFLVPQGNLGLPQLCGRKGRKKCGKIIFIDSQEASLPVIYYKMQNCKFVLCGDVATG